MLPKKEMAVYLFDSHCGLFVPEVKWLLKSLNFERLRAVTATRYDEVAFWYDGSFGQLEGELRTLGIRLSKGRLANIEFGYEQELAVRRRRV